MKWFLLSLFITAGITGIGMDSHAETGQLMNRHSAEIYTKDEAKFLAIKDEKGHQQFLKTIALLRFDENGIKFEAGEMISTEKTETTILRY
jgi:hypothetical protein